MPDAPTKPKATSPTALPPPNVGAEQYAKLTVERLQRIQSQLTTAPRAGKLKGKVCIITGVGSIKGIGRATAFAYAHQGARHLYLLDYDGSNLPDLEESLKKAYPDVKVTTQQADAADDAAISGICQRAIKEEGRLDVFFANAGIVNSSFFTDLTEKEFMHMMRVNVLSCFLAIKHGSAAMQITSADKNESSGSIILTASVAGIRSGAGPMDYSASKAAVNSLAQTGSHQLGFTNIRVNTICPGLIETGMTTATFDYARAKGVGGKIGQLVPLKRYGVPQEIANAALFLASDDSSFVNGQNIAVDGGLSASHPVAPGRWA
ncbi:3-oxoacyl-[acyl-carrier-protein] reductase FabG OS=Thermotoga maritima (strain ATCC 43589 / MSB8 / DSM 3109 / JCM 10099) GN=fabG PE=3 SV=1 [Rhizoctonia solani AG-1 IB]|uniref:3-oxoacyl-[acyl-carrier-protein] reductase FabG n=1 Tax=Thanatephorus cucumeris (strain AG1-IB / isolate 7/3/14) TaxID=1108050 RepID=A0A0B7FV87_THACB|nr:3-oxoacyl-[acyl-carrier-protein] reductase FabG OS=Thermotoga maritima (strain ATCC 43589 / MSB8 / DSM 3109 / JCM 10099) GN=fabG PE=3 SV=1 [Rhizoctonia solani AG-1 IB]